MLIDNQVKIRNDNVYHSKMSTNKLKKFTSFRHNREIVNIGNGEIHSNFRNERRQSFSCDPKVDASGSNKNDFLSTLQKWKLWERKKPKLSSADKRKSASISDVCDIKLMRQVEQGSDINLCRSDGNLPIVAESPITTESFRADFRAKLEHALAKGPSPKVCILF